MIKKLILHFNFMKELLSKEPMSMLTLASVMEKEFGVGYNYVNAEVNELISLNKIKKIKHNNEMLLLWTKEVIKFEYELSNNMIQLDKQYIEFNTIPSKVRQMKLPLYILYELNKKIADLGEKLELMLELKAVKSNGVWYKINRSEN